MRAPGADARTRGMRKLTAVPISAIAITMIPISHSRSCHTSNIAPPAATPTTIATNVLISRMPFARDRSRSGSISGRIPYFAGLKNVACSANRTA